VVSADRSVDRGPQDVRGHAEIRQYYKDLAEFSDQSHAENSEVHDLGDQVLALGHLSMRFASGVELDQEVAVSSRGGTESTLKRVPT
jgi:hypothetical protein